MSKEKFPTEVIGALVFAFFVIFCLIFMSIEKVYTLSLQWVVIQGLIIGFIGYFFGRWFERRYKK